MSLTSSHESSGVLYVSRCGAPSCSRTHVNSAAYKGRFVFNGLRPLPGKMWEAMPELEWLHVTGEVYLNQWRPYRGACRQQRLAMHRSSSESSPSSIRNTSSTRSNHDRQQQPRLPEKYLWQFLEDERLLSLFFEREPFF